MSSRVLELFLTHLPLLQYHNSISIDHLEASVSDEQVVLRRISPEHLPYHHLRLQRPPTPRRVVLITANGYQNLKTSQSRAVAQL